MGKIKALSIKSEPLYINLVNINIMCCDLRPWALTSQSTIVQSWSHNVRVAPLSELKGAQQENMLNMVLEFLSCLGFVEDVDISISFSELFWVVQSFARFYYKSFKKVLHMLITH